MSKKEEWNKRCREYRAKRNAEKVKAQNLIPRDLKYPDGVEYEKPFTKVDNGFGFRGVLLADTHTGEVQCHICGGWFDWLQIHIIKNHKIKAKEYRERFGLGYRTALCSETVREQLVRRAMTFPWERLHRQGKLLGQMSREHKTHKNKRDYSKGAHTDEWDNKNGTCTLQLFDKMEKLSEKLGRIPHVDEMDQEYGANLRVSITKKYGSMDQMRKLLTMKGYMYKYRKEQSKITNEQLLESLRMFANTYKRRPVTSDFSRGILFCDSTYYSRFGSMRRAKELAFGQNGHTIKDFI